MRARNLIEMPGAINMQQYLNRIPKISKPSDVTRLVREINADNDLTFDDRRYLILQVKNRMKQIGIN